MTASTSSKTLGCGLGWPRRGSTCLRRLPSPVKGVWVNKHVGSPNQMTSSGTTDTSSRARIESSQHTIEIRILLMSLLASEVAKPGDVVEQLASRQEIVVSPGIIGAATKLYYDRLEREVEERRGRERSRQRTTTQRPHRAT